MSRFHSKFHRHNHHTAVPSASAEAARFPDAAWDPIASPSNPFQGVFYSEGNITTTKNLSAGGWVYSDFVLTDVVYTQDLDVGGTITFDNPLGIASGGTGADNAATALSNLGISLLVNSNQLTSNAVLSIPQQRPDFSAGLVWNPAIPAATNITVLSPYGDVTLSAPGGAVLYIPRGRWSTFNIGVSGANNTFTEIANGTIITATDISTSVVGLSSNNVAGALWELYSRILDLSASVDGGGA